jgi:dUTP pyrophosphatase
MQLPKIILLRDRTILAESPTKSHPDDAGWDLYCLEDTVIWPKCAVDIDTGWDIKIPDHHWGLLTARSSTFKRRRLVVQEGVIDPGYTGPCTILVWNPGFLPKRVKAGERLAQLIIVPLPATALMIVDELPLTGRGTKSFGSSGN